MYTVIIDQDYIKVIDSENKELVGWSRDEWEEDPETVIPAIGNAIALAYTEPLKLKRLLAQ